MNINPSDIELSDINKMLVYEQQSRVIDKLDREEAIEFAKAYFKLYLKQQEVVASLAKL
jgi:hypothetical protein